MNQETKQRATAFLLAVVGAATGAKAGVAHADVLYDVTGRVRAFSNENHLLPFSAEAGDELRVRAVVDETTPRSTDPNLTDPWGGSFYEGAIRSMTVSVNGAQVLPAGPLTSFASVIHVLNDAYFQPSDPRHDELAVTASWTDGVSSIDTLFHLTDDATGTLLSSAAIPVALDAGRATHRGLGINAFGINQHDFVDAELVSFTIAPSTAAPAPPNFGSGVPRTKTWLTAATAAQVTTAPPTDGRRIDAALWFNAFDDAVTLQFAEQGSAGVNRAHIRCGLAGTDGPIVWSSASLESVSGQSFEIFQGSLARTGPSTTCPIEISNIASLKAAAEARLLYLELERSGSSYRGQLWSRSLGLQDQHVVFTAGASDQQVVGSVGRRWVRATAELWFSEVDQTLDSIGYAVPKRQRFKSVSLHCGPPGRDGDLIAMLAGAQGVLTNHDIVPAHASGACGLGIYNTASLFEALLRGNLYVEMETFEPADLKLRGQFPMP